MRALAWVIAVVAWLRDGVRLIWRHILRRPYDLGTVLMQMGVIEPHHVGEAAEIQRAEPSKRLGDVLVSLGHIREDHLTKALSLQKRLRNGERMAAEREIATHNLKSAMRRLTTTGGTRP